MPGVHGADPDGHVLVFGQVRVNREWEAAGKTMKSAGGSRTRFRGFADRRPAVRPRRLACFGPLPEGHVLARNRTWSSTFAGSRANPSHPEDVDRNRSLASPPPGNRTRACGFEGRRASATPAGKEPSALARNRTWSSTFGGRVPSVTLRGPVEADGRARTGMNPLTRQRPHRSATSAKAGTQGFEPCPRVLEARCSPRSTPLKVSTFHVIVASAGVAVRVVCVRQASSPLDDGTIC